MGLKSRKRPPQKLTNMEVDTARLAFIARSGRTAALYPGPGKAFRVWKAEKDAALEFDAPRGVEGDCTDLLEKSRS